MVISIRAELPEDFVLTVRNDSGGDMLFRTSTDVEDLKEWNLGAKKEIQIDIDSETGIILGWNPITVKQVNKKINAQRRERIELRTSDTQNMFWRSAGGWYEWHYPTPPVNLDEVYAANELGRLSEPPAGEAQALNLQEFRNALNRMAERMASDEERT